jgi:hypothetical protein
MSWGIVAGAVIGGVASYAGTQSTNSANARASRGAGTVDVTTTRNPLGGTLPYRSDATEAAYEALFGHQSGYSSLDGTPGPNVQSVGGGQSGVSVVTPGVIPGITQPTGGTGGGRGPSTWTNAKGQAMTLDAHGRAVPAGTGGGSPPSAPAGPGLNNTSAPGGGKFNGMSQYTQDAENALRGLPAQEQGLYDTGQQYVQDTLQGKDQNPLRGLATTAGQNISEDPQLAAYEAALRGDLGVGNGGSGGGPIAPSSTGSGGTIIQYGSGGSGGLAGQSASAYGSSTGADKAIRDMLAGKATAGQTAAEDAITAQVERGRAANIRELRARAEGSGFYGGTVYQQLEEGAMAQGDQATAEQIAASRFGAYQNAMGLGAQYDLGMADVNARNNASAASGAANAASLAQQAKLTELGMWGNAIQTGQQGRSGTASALGNLSGQYSNDQQAGLAGIGQLAGNRRADLTAAGDLSLGSDQARNSYGVGMANANASRTVGMANVTLGQQDLAFRQQQFNDPLNRISAFSNALNGLTGAYGTETTAGMDRRSQSPAPYQNPYGAAVTGAGVGGQVGGAFNSTGSQSGGSYHPDGSFW